MNKRNTSLIVFGLIVFAQLLSGFANFAAAQRPPGSVRSQQSSQEKSLLAGTWQSSDSTMEIRTNGTMTLNGKQYSYKISNAALVITNNDKTVNFPFELNGDYLTITLSSQRIMYGRVKGNVADTSDEEQIFGGNSRKNNVSSEIVGRWKSDKGILEFSDDGIMTINGEQVPYKINGSAITVSSAQGALNFPFQVSNDRLIMGAAGKQVVYTRIEGGGNLNQDRNEQPFNNKQSKGIVGRWQSDEATVEIRGNGTLTINGQQYSYKANDSTITISDNEGSMSLPYQITNDKMIVNVQGRRVIYTRISGNASNNAGGETNNRGGGVLPELVGKWCYIASVNPSSGNMRTSDRCFTLYANGTYEYYGENYTSGGGGSYTSATRDSGRWSATSTSITAYSSTTGTTTFRLEKRNHPKNNDPMLLLDGEAFVSAYQKQPW
ncbi:MAG TPA: hypothetical protein VK308_06880 [Pyrinomonadaceae bacterium]|nr:hypothetical protein [Pyrinomonadaceae bacterium]